MTETIIDRISASGKASHTYVTPKNERTYAIGRIRQSCLSREIISERMPLPTAWNTVENIMPTAAGKKHRLINLSAGIPIAYISSVALNIAKSSLGNI